MELKSWIDVRGGEEEGMMQLQWILSDFKQYVDNLNKMTQKKSSTETIQFLWSEFK